MKLNPRDTQTQVKHTILEKYLKAWAGIIMRGLDESGRLYAKKYDIHFIYVDCFANSGMYSGDVQDVFLELDDGPVMGSPFIGIQALDKAANVAKKQFPNVDVRTNVILIENNRQNYQDLLTNLADEGLGDRIRETTDFHSLYPGEIAAVQQDVTKMGAKLLNYTKRPRDYTWAFYLIDPFGPSGIPLDFVTPIVSTDHHDVMINFMYMDLHRKTGTYERDGKLQLKHPKHAEYWTKVFGSNQWVKVIEEIGEIRSLRDNLFSAFGLTEDEAVGDPLFKDAWDEGVLTDSQLTELTERRLVSLYKDTLKKAAPRPAIKDISLHFPTQERTFFYLFLTTHDGTGALTMNRILHDARMTERDLRWIRRQAASIKASVPDFQPFLIKPEKPEPPAAKETDRPSKEECAEAIMKKAARRRITLRELFIEMADDIFFDSEVKSAVNYLRKEKRARFNGKLSNKTEIRFRS